MKCAADLDAARKGLIASMLFDTHAQYDDEALDEDRETLLESMPERGIGLILNPGCDLASSEKAVSLARQFRFVYAAVGWHPHEAKSMDESGADFIRSCSKDEKVVAIGEIGLDYHYDYSPRDVQREKFAEQMGLARELGLPVIIHDRDAHADCMEIVRRFPEVRGVFHCYSGSAEMAMELVRLGWSVSFTGAITFKNARRAIEALAVLPHDRIMLETDAPYMTPVPHRGKRNDSSYMTFIAAAAAAAMGLSPEEAAELTTRNAKEFFRI